MTVNGGVKNVTRKAMAFFSLLLTPRNTTQRNERTCRHYEIIFVLTGCEKYRRNNRSLLFGCLKTTLHRILILLQHSVNKNSINQPRVRRVSARYGGLGSAKREGSSCKAYACR